MAAYSVWGGVRRVRYGAVPLVGVLVGLGVGGGLGGSRLLAQGAQGAQRSTIPVPRPMPVGPLAAVCQTPLRETRDLRALVRTLGVLLPADYPRRQVDGLRLVPLPRPRDANASLTPVAGFERSADSSVLYWTPEAHGGTLLHELTHAVQYDLRPTALLRLLDSLAEADARGAFSADDVAGATASLRLVVISSSPPAQQTLVRDAVDRALATPPLRRQGIMARRVRAVTTLLAQAGFEEVRAQLMPTHPRRFGYRVANTQGLPWSWREEVRAVAMLELMAYQAERLCAEGRPSPHWVF